MTAEHDITGEGVRAAIAVAGDNPHFHHLCFTHPDPWVRAGFQWIFWAKANGVVPEMHTTEAHARSTPAGRTIPADVPFPAVIRRPAAAVRLWRRLSVLDMRGLEQCS